MLRGEDGNQAKELDRLAEWLVGEKPDVVCLSNALFMGLARRIKQETGALVACTLQGEDGFLDALPEPDRTASWDTLTEREKDVDAFIAVSQYHADLMIRRAKLPPERVHVVYNGILLDGYGTAPTPPDPPALGYLARMHPAKGLETLVEAFILLCQRDRIKNLQLRVAGAQVGGDAAYVEKLREHLTAAGVSDRATFHPNIDRAEKIAFLQSLSVLSVPATYGESFGLYVIEALAAGVPVVQPRHAVFPELLAETGGGVLCEPDDPDSLADAVENLLADPQAARALGEEGRRNVFARFNVDEMARNVVRVFEQASRPAAVNTPV
jgi:glycosyltransferase involved in cell wall biosynthesis